MASTDATAVPVKNQAYRITFPILDADGDLVTAAASLDSEVSKDAGTFADCTNEATEIATSSGVYYLDLTATEMNADTVAVIVKTGTAGAKTTTVVLYPQEADDIRVSVTHFGGTAGTFASGRPEVNTSHAAGTAWGSGAITAAALAADAGAEIADAVWDEARSGHVTDGSFGQAFQVVDSGTAQGGGTNSITLRAGYSSGDDRINGSLVYILSGTGAGQGNLINDYNNTTKVATVDNNWAVTPDGTSVYILYPGSAGATTVAVAAAVWNAARATYNTPGTFGEGQNVVSLSGDSTAADNLEAMLDGTGGTTLSTGIAGNITGNITGNLSGSVGSVTAGVTVTTNNDKTGYSLSNPAGLKTNTAFTNFEFLMVDSSDHVSPKTGLTVTATRSIDGAAFASCANAVSEVSSGVYKIDLAAADLNGTCITFKFTATGADQTTITVVTEP
jgi:hypothetical protein